MSQGCGGSAGRQESLTPVYSPLSLEGNGRLVPGSVQRGDQLVRGRQACLPVLPLFSDSCCLTPTSSLMAPEL